MKFAFSSNAFTNYSLSDSLKEIAQIGYEGAEIMCDIPHAYPPSLDSNKIKEIQNTLSQNNLEISNLNAFTLFALGDTYHPSWIETNEEKRQDRVNHTIACIELAFTLDAKNISVEPGGPLKTYDNLTRPKALEFFKEGIEQVLLVAEKKKINVLVEPEPGLLLETSTEFLEFIKNFDSQFLKLNFDIGHFYCVNEDPSELILKLRDHIGHFHMADIKDRIHNHLIPGLGNIDFKKVFKSMQEISYDGFVTVELYPYKENPIDAATKSINFLRALKY
ncbi:MAG TPA: sugar phosphate isomerase/epimerase [Candidatus Saccharimonadales bacterium]|nr:sugar phosphate isomerase/epimerase [Candidatus Saccharimonadales bacterium]